MACLTNQPTNILLPCELVAVDLLYSGNNQLDNFTSQNPYPLVETNE